MTCSRSSKVGFFRPMSTSSEGIDRRSFSSKVGQLAGNHFLTIVSGTEHLRELGRLTLWEGAQPIAIKIA